MTTQIDVSRNPLIMGNGGGSYMLYMAIDINNNIYYSEYQYSTIRKITPEGTISIVAGNGTSGIITENVLATTSMLNRPYAIVFDTIGNMYFSDTNNYVVAKVNTSGIITIFAGTNGQTGVPTAGTATACKFSISGLAIDRNDNIYISDINNSLILKVTSAGILSIIQITSGIVQNPNNVQVDAVDNLYYRYNNIIYKISTTGVVTPVAGNGTTGIAVAGLATNTSIGTSWYNSFTVSSDGIIYIPNRASCNILMVKSGFLYYIAGNNTPGALTQNLNLPIYRAMLITIDKYSNILFFNVDNYNTFSTGNFSKLTIQTAIL